MSYHGVTCAIEKSKLDALIDKENIGTLDGGTGPMTFYTKNFPITTSGGVATDDETLVNVYSRDVAGASYVELDDDGSDFTIVGATGAVTVLGAYNQAGVAGDICSIDYYTEAEIGSGQTALIEASRDLIERYKLGGDGDVEEIKAGKKHFKVEYDTFYITRDELGPILSEKDFSKALTEYDFFMYPNKKVSGQPRIKCSNIVAKFERIETNLDSLVLVKGSFMGRALDVDTVP